jgi:hypothetical protein
MVFRSGDVVAHHPDVQVFLGLKGDLLLAEDAQFNGSDLYVYDLRKKAKVLEVPGVEDDLAWSDGTTLLVWVIKAYEKSAVAAGCPDTVPANPPVLDSLMGLQLERLELRPTGRFRCRIGT